MEWAIQTAWTAREAEHVAGSVDVGGHARPNAEAVLLYLQRRPGTRLRPSMARSISVGASPPQRERRVNRIVRVSRDRNKVDMTSSGKSRYPIHRSV